NAETTDLWDAIETSSRQPVRALMDSWVFQPGYPLITVRAEQTTLTLTQQRFLYLQDDAAHGQSWQVPLFLRIKTAAGVQTQTLLLTESVTRLTLPAAPEWVVVNADGAGFYRARYSHDLL